MPAPGRRRRRSSVGLAIAALLLAIYVVSNPSRTSYYNHFVWQAEAFLDGRAGDPLPRLRRPARARQRPLPGRDPDDRPNGEPTGYALLPFPPLPAVVLMPFVAVWGLATDAQLVAAMLGAIDVAHRVLGPRPAADRPARPDRDDAVLRLGTVLWYAAELGTTWYLAHVVAVGPDPRWRSASRSAAIRRRATGRRRPATRRRGVETGRCPRVGSGAASAWLDRARSWPGSCSAWPARPG